MKKIYMILLIALFTLVGCSSSNENVKNQTNGQNTAQRTANNVVNGAEEVIGDIGNGVKKAANGVANTITGKNVTNNNTSMSATKTDNTMTTNDDNYIKNKTTNNNNMMNGTTADNNMINKTTNDNSMINRTTADNNMINRTTTESGVDVLGGYNSSNVNTRNAIDNTNNIASDDLSQRATRIAKALNKINGVEKATVVITGEVALVGLNIANNISDEQITKIKKEAEQITLNTDTGIKNTAITAAPEIVDRIVNISGDIGNGKPLSGLADELGSLIRRITPTM